MAISDWPEGERPRERLLSLGPQALSDAELLAIFLRVGVRGKSAVDLARELLAHVGGDIGKLMATSAADLAKRPGMGMAKATQLAATLELARRAISARLIAQDVLSSPQAVRDWLQLRLAALPHEVFLTLWLDSGNRLIAADEIFRGTLSSTSVHPREIVKQALARNAAAVILAHNHPSGRPEPSSADVSLTKALKDALALVDVRVLDHFIVAPGQDPRSLAETGLI
jgi:DNA repair protein RadC